MDECNNDRIPLQKAKLSNRLFNRRLLYWLAIFGYGFFLAALLSIPVLFSRIEASELERMQYDQMCFHNGGNTICEPDVSAVMILMVGIPAFVIAPAILVASIAFIWEIIQRRSLRVKYPLHVLGISLGTLSALFYFIFW